MIRLVVFSSVLLAVISSTAIAQNTERFPSTKWLIYQTATTSTPMYIERTATPANDESVEQKISERLSRSVISNETATSTPIKIKEYKPAEMGGEAIVMSPDLAPMRTINTLVGRQSCSSNETNSSASFVICNNEPEQLVIKEMITRNFANLIQPLLPLILDVNTCSTFQIVGGTDVKFDCSGMFAVSFYAYTGSYSAQDAISVTIVD